MTKVLVVDDVETYRKYLALALEDENYDVRTARGGHDAIKIGNEFKPDILVVDWMLNNDIDGIEVSAQLEKSKPGMETVLITGYPSPGLKREVLRSNIAHFIEKPFTLADIVEAVDRISERRTTRDAAER